jgi:hypothetical protein
MAPSQSQTQVRQGLVARRDASVEYGGSHDTGGMAAVAAVG